MISVNRVLILLGAFVAFAGWAVAVGGIAKLEDYCNDVINELTDDSGVHRICSDPFSFHYWGIWLTFFVTILIFIMELLGKVGPWTSTLQALCATSLAVTMIDTDVGYHELRRGKWAWGDRWDAIRVAFAGFIIMDVALFALIFFMGLEGAGYAKPVRTSSNKTVPAEY